MIKHFFGCILLLIQTSARALRHSLERRWDMSIAWMESTGLPKLEEFLLKHFKAKVIYNCVGDPYLLRIYLLRTESFALFFHKFIRSDEDRALHDHPWNFIVLPIWQGYIEHSDKPCNCSETSTNYACIGGRIAVKRRVYPFLGIRARPSTYRHRVELIDGRHSYSLFFRFKEHRTWGFWPKEGFIDWKSWWSNLCE